MVAIVLVVACKNGKDAGKGTEVVQNTASPSLAAPKITVATVLAKDADKPPLLMILDADGTARLGAVKTWAELDANKVQVAKKGAKVAILDRYVRESVGLGRDPIEAVTAWDKQDGTAIDLTTLEDNAKKPGTAQDDPPPPEGNDESGGTGTAMALDEGKMGKKDSDRAEGQYQMKRDDARTNGVLGSEALHPGVGISSLGSLGPDPDGMPSRVAEVEGAVEKDGKLEPMRAMLVAAPTAKATALIDALRETGDGIAVSVNGKIRPLNLEFALHDSASSPEPVTYWLEARVSAKGVVVEAVPDKPIEVTALDQLAGAIDKARTARSSLEPGAVDVLVDPDVDVQHAIDVIVALDVAGVKVIGMGRAPSGEELSRRGHRITVSALGQPATNGDLDKAEVRKVVKSAKQKITYCYEKTLLAKPTIKGTVQVQFFIKPDGTVGNAAANGFDPDVASCLEDVIKSLSFPKPKSGGGVQVNYPFSFHQ